MMRVRVGNPFHEQHELFNPEWSFRHYDFVTWPDTDPHDIALAIESVVPELCLFVRGTSLKERVWRPDATNQDKTSKWYKTHWFEEEVFQQDGSPNKQGWANGVVWTSARQVDVEQDPAIHVSFGLYNQPCNDPKCMAGHMNDKKHRVSLHVAPKLEQWQIDAIEEEIGINKSYPLMRRAVRHNQHVLSTLGFLPLDAPLKQEAVTYSDMYSALDFLAREDENAISSIADRFFDTKCDAHEVLALCAGGGGTFAYKLGELIRLGYPVELEYVEKIIKARML